MPLFKAKDIMKSPELSSPSLSMPNLVSIKVNVKCCSMKVICSDVGQNIVLKNWHSKIV